MRNGGNSSNECAAFRKLICFLSLISFKPQMLLSDIIVWWRALAIWPRNKLVWAIGIVLLVTTGGTYKSHLLRLGPLELLTASL